MSVEVIKAKDYKVAAKFEDESGKQYDILTPNYDQAKAFEEVNQSGDAEKIFEAFATVGLPKAVARTIPLTALKAVAKKLAGEDAPEKK